MARAHVWTTLKIVLILAFLNSAPLAAKIYTFGVTSDSGQFGVPLAHLKKSLETAGIKNLLLIGDNAPDLDESGELKTYPEIWQDWKEQFNFTAVAVGNHSRGDREEMDFFGKSSDVYATTIDDQIRFIVLNSAKAKKKSGLVPGMLNFLETQLKTAQEKQIFILLHHPPATIAPKHPWTERRELSEGIWQLVNKYRPRVTGIIAAHVHVGTVADVSGTPLIISPSAVSGIPGEYYNSKDPELGLQVTTQWTYTQPAHRYWIKMEIDSDTQSTRLNYIDLDASNQVECTITIASGRYQFSNGCQRTK